MSITIRMAKKEDAKEIQSIYAYYVKNSSATFEYEIPSMKEMEDRICETLKFFPYLVAEENNKVVGYAYASFFHPRIAYRFSCEVTIYTDRNAQKKGIGKILYDALETCLIKQNFQNFNACITASNINSISFHEKRGYVKCAHFHHSGYKFDTWEDVIWMEKQVGNHSKNPTELKSIHEIDLDFIS